MRWIFRLPWYVSADVPGDCPGIGIESTTRRGADDKVDCLVFVKVLREVRCGGRNEKDLND